MIRAPRKYQSRLALIGAVSPASSVFCSVALIDEPLARLVQRNATPTELIPSQVNITRFATASCGPKGPATPVEGQLWPPGMPVKLQDASQLDTALMPMD